MTALESFLFLNSLPTPPLKVEVKMDRSLILHIGYHRTGTTTLQELVFPKLTRLTYFCKDATPASAEVIEAFMYPPEIWRRDGQHICRRLLSEMAEGQGTGSALISGERISMHDMFTTPGKRDPDGRIIYNRDPSILAEQLRECQAAAQSAGFNRLKVIMGIRRQDQFLGSFYAKVGWQSDNPGQEDFELQTLEIIDQNKRYFPNGAWLDYKATRDLIAGALGEDGVLVLPLEQLSNESSRYFSALSEFLGEPLSARSTVGRLNGRSLAPDVWEIKGMLKPLRKKRYGKLRALFARPPEVRLSPELKETILAPYRDSNRLLASGLNIDLAQYGYCGASPRVQSSD